MGYHLVVGGFAVRLDVVGDPFLRLLVHQSEGVLNLVEKCLLVLFVLGLERMMKLFLVVEEVE